MGKKIITTHIPMNWPISLSRHFLIGQPLLLFYKDFDYRVRGLSAKCWFVEDHKIMVGTVPDQWMDLPEDESSEWKNISTVPHDRPILLFYPDQKMNIAIGQWYEARQDFIGRRIKN